MVNSGQSARNPARSPESMASNRENVLDAIAFSTGIPKRLLQRIKLSMDQRVYYPLLQSFLVRGLVPSSSDILLRLLMNPRTGRVSYQQDPARLFSEYHIVVQSSQGKLFIAARMKVYGRRGFFRRQFHGHITIRYHLETHDERYEYRQDFILKGPGSLKLKQFGYKKPIMSQTGQAVSMLAQVSPVALLAPARAIHL